MRSKFFFILFFSLLSFCGIAQDFLPYVNEGDKQFDEGNYYGAAWMYKKAMGMDGSLTDVIFKYAESCRLNNEFNEAEKYYLRILENKNNKFPLALFWLADVQKSQGYYQRAQKNFREYTKLHPTETDYYIKKAKRELVSCEKALEIKFNPLDVSIIHLDTSVNTVNGEFGTSVITDSIMFYSSLVPVKNTKDTNLLVAKIFSSKIVNDTIFKKGILLDSLINTPGFHVTNPSYSIKTQMLYFSKYPINPSLGKSQIYRSKNLNGKWMNPEKLPDIINRPGRVTTQPSIANLKSGEMLLFVSDRAGSNGNLDIWYTPIKNDGTFGKVLNVGVRMDVDTALAYLSTSKIKINSIDDDISPFYDVFDSTLYFSTRWHDGLGNFDIFKTKGDFYKWEEPQNIGYPLNSSWNDVYFTMDSKGHHAYFASNRKGSLSKKKESCCNDIWTYKFTKRIKADSLLTVEQLKKLEKEKEERQVKVFEKEIKLLVPLTLYFDNDYPNPKTNDTITNSNYEFLFEQYTTKTEEFRTKFSHGLSKREAIIAADEVDDFFKENVQNGYNKLIEFTELAENLLLKNQVIVITMKGYTSPLNTFDYNKNLAKRRISSLMNYFLAYKDGFFKKYVDNKQLILEQVPVGKLANTNVSEDLKDTRNSVYSPAASGERKIQIIAVQLTR